ncbi:MAG: phosphoribosyltransferase [Nitrospinaceae bacterium]
MFSRIIKEGLFTLSNGVKSSYNYDYACLSDTMSAAYCQLLNNKLEIWQNRHGKFNVVVGIETQGIRIGYQLSQLMNLPFYILPKKRIDFAQVGVPQYPPETHWLIVDDIVTTGSSYIRAVNYLEIEEKPETITFACMIRRNPANLDYSAVHGDPDKEQLGVPDERFDFIDKRLVSLYSEPM